MEQEIQNKILTKINERNQKTEVESEVEEIRRLERHEAFMRYNCL